MGKRTLRAGIIGTGRIADLYDDETVHLPEIDVPDGVVHANMYGVKPVSHAGAYRSVSGYDLVAAASRGEERLRAFGERHGVNALYTDYRAMLTKERLDVVSICTQSPEKRDAVIACAEAGVPAVIVEKAFATSLQEADEMLAACNRSGTFVAVHHPMRFSLMYRRVKEIVEKGLIGKLGAISCYSGSLVHGGTHDMDLMCFLAGMPKRVWAEIPDLEPASADPFEADYPDLRANAMITFENGVTGSFTGASATSGGFTVRGTEGYVTAPRSMGVLSLVQTRQRPAREYGYEEITSGGRSIRPVRWEESVEAWPENGAANETSSSQLLLREVHASLTQGAPFLSVGRDGVLALELSIACYDSALRRQPVELPLTERKLRVINR